MEVGARIFTSTEISLEVGSRFTPMEVGWSCHGSRWKFPLSLGVVASIAFINCNFLEYIPWKLPWASKYMSFQIYLTYLHLPPRVSQTSSCFQKISLTPTWSYLHGRRPTSNFHGRRWKYCSLLIPWKLELLRWRYVEAFTEVDEATEWSYFNAYGSVCRATSMRVGSFHWSWFKFRWRLVESPSMDISMEVNLLPWSKTFHGSKFTSMEVGGFHGSWKLPWTWSYFHGSRWKFPWK